MISIEVLPRLGPTVADYPPGSAFGPREARSYQFVWLLRGSATWVWDDVLLPLVPGKLLLIRPGMRDSFRWDPRTMTRHAYVHFTLDGHGRPDWPLVRDLTGRHDPMGALCRYLLWLGSECPPGWRAQAGETLRLLVLTFLAGPSPVELTPAALPEPVVEMMHAVREHWADGVARPIPMRQLAAAAQVSASTLCRMFRRRFGIGPVAAIELLRLTRAEPLLWQSNLSMQAIAVQCGFADAYHFSRRFRAIYRMAPTTFRVTAPENAPPSPVESGGLAALQSLLPSTHGHLADAGAPSTSRHQSSSRANRRRVFADTNDGACAQRP
ncbi:helix-turn-helix transcriptional regulator [Nonomuraea wenchangensis]|uniref:Helix-turn-helix domain-containing protein n=1 Tax=Nonomuraea wenchangensis TaxID=568860 RepID=A0A1I0LUE8_9ACTN|nr:helix-turn-helix transcriptional regulator [Nonomuraea wenchangensis]SEU47211.1 Helix-turn-helix domain-containing protein [Nonomuraea wenchangensis]